MSELSDIAWGKLGTEEHNPTFFLCRDSEVDSCAGIMMSQVGWCTTLHTTSLFYFDHSES